MYLKLIIYVLFFEICLFILIDYKFKIDSKINSTKTLLLSKLNLDSLLIKNQR